MISNSNERAIFMLLSVIILYQLKVDYKNDAIDENDELE
jgi:hypothetical protein